MNKKDIIDRLLDENDFIVFVAGDGENGIRPMSEYERRLEAAQEIFRLREIIATKTSVNNQNVPSNMQVIYFDDEDEKEDGFGWNIVSEDSSIAVRFETKGECIEWCESEGLPYTWKKRDSIHGCI